VSSSFPVDPNEHDRFILRQRFRLVINEYQFSLPQGQTDAPGPPFCFVQQKRFKFKEDIRFYVDDSRTNELMRIKARQRFDPAARYDVTTPEGDPIGQIQKVFGTSLLRSTYILYDSSGAEVARVTEKNLLVALFRRLIGFIPQLGNFANWLPIPYHFVFQREGIDLGVHRRHLWKLADIYTIDLTSDPQHTLDRRLALATAVGLDALQAR
jgi:uncharacterized protein YxjI